jgi:hypothetical protein
MHMAPKPARLILFGPLLVLLATCGGDAPPRILVALHITPSRSIIPNGLTQQLAASAAYNDSSTLELTSSVAWLSHAPNVAVVSPSGLVTARSEGIAAISARYMEGEVTVTSIVSVNVAPAIVQSIAITPNPAISGIDLPLQLTASATYSDSSVVDVSTIAAWSSGNPSIVAVDPTTGLTRGLSLGSSTISASLGSITERAPLVIVANTWTSTANLSWGRASHLATSLPNDKVLVVDGCCTQPGQNEVGAEIFDFASRSWTSTPGFQPRVVYGGTATRLPDGKVLVVGGLAIVP